MIKLPSGFTLLFIVTAIAFIGPVYASDFSCPIGTRGACLGYGDKVVDQNATCFDSYACGFKGFVCKAKFDDVVDEYTRLRNTCSNVAQEQDDLVDRYNDLVSEHAGLVSEHDDLESEHDDLERRYRRLKDCVNGAQSVNEAHNCSLY